jgi:hypothetical protein
MYDYEFDGEMGEDRQQCPGRIDGIWRTLYPFGA